MTPCNYTHSNWIFWQGAMKRKATRVYINIHEDCELSGNPDKNSSAKSLF
ncbi:MAG: hypothetical protein RLY40_629 [Pseudomonadota bacterium]|jgi:hypothetical protein